MEVYFFPDHTPAGNFPDVIAEEINSSTHFVLFVSSKTPGSAWQNQELLLWKRKHDDRNSELTVASVDGTQLPDFFDTLVGKVHRQFEDLDPNNEEWAPRIALKILRALCIENAPFDDLPVSLQARYEKDIIKEYLGGNGRAGPELVAEGYPATWPDVLRHPEDSESASWSFIGNPLDQGTHGSFRDDDAAVLVDARIARGDANRGSIPCALTFPEAGPRKRILNAAKLKVGVLVSGGIAPGINAVISGIFQRHQLYKDSVNRRDPSAQHVVDVLGYNAGFRALSRTALKVDLDKLSLTEAVNRGGSILPTSREDDLLTKEPVRRAQLLEDMARTVEREELDILYVIGGEGSMRAAHALQTVHRRKFPQRTFSVIGVPKTMDNDILWVWQSFGFLSAVEKARELIIQLHTEVSSNPRLAIVQLFGSVSGYVVSHAAFGSNVCDLALIPEMTFSMRKVCEYMGRVLTERQVKGVPAAAMVVMAETAIPQDYEHFLDAPYVGLTDEEKKALAVFKSNGQRVVGQTPDHLRKAALKIVSGVLSHYVTHVMGFAKPMTFASGRTPEAAPRPYFKDYRILTNEPRHVLRSIPPSVTDVAFGVRLGTMAVDMAMAGYYDCMVSQWLTEYVVVPLKLVVLGRKEVPTSGIFWRTVVSKTGQPSLEEPEPPHDLVRA